MRCGRIRRVWSDHRPDAIRTRFVIYTYSGGCLANANIDLDLHLIERAKELTGESSSEAVVKLALRQLIASQQKGKMVSGIAELSDLEVQLGSLVIKPISRTFD
ncbi:MAG: type II toxin-antitoxin system VapB family antitoxin [Ancrocorticia sp.]|uniref:type II toxin-antitoxin system VapB family antitoxin n=1 Tax=Ancrocorticia sp. TaxID=2593684 RepID=UPI003F91BB05